MTTASYDGDRDRIRVVAGVKADADVQWTDPNALSREQLIRAQSLQLAAMRLGPRRKEPEQLAIAELIRAADKLADWIRGGPVA